MTPNVIERLREAIAAERKPYEPTEIADDTGGKVIDLMVALKNSLRPQTTDAALAVVEQEIAELRKRLAAVRVAFVAWSRHCERLNIPITETAWIHGHRISAEDSDAGAAMLARLCDLLGITVEDATSNAEGGT